MKICVYGAGAIGGFLAARLALADEPHDISVVSRGDQLRAIQKDGLRLVEGEAERVVAIQAAGDPAELGTQDYVIMAVKAHAGPEVARAMVPLLGDDTAVVTAMNGVPWWYFHELPGPWRDHQLESVDPGGDQWRLIGPERVIGCVVYPACEVNRPGSIRHLSGDRFTLGEPDNQKTPRLRALSRAFIDAGLKAPLRQIRNEIWIKLWGNLTFNPISALTGATLDVIATESGTRRLAAAMMAEAKGIGEELGVRFPISIDERIAGAAGAGPHRTSMLQDLERGRPMEIDALVTAVQELGRLVGHPTPTIDGVLSLVQLRARVAGCY